MPLPVSLKKVVDQVDQSIEGYQAFINRRTGELFGGDVGLMDEEDGDETLPSWMRREGAKLNALSRSIDWLPLPDDEGVILPHLGPVEVRTFLGLRRVRNAQPARVPETHEKHHSPLRR